MPTIAVDQLQASIAERPEGEDGWNLDEVTKFISDSTGASQEDAQCVAYSIIESLSGQNVFDPNAGDGGTVAEGAADITITGDQLFDALSVVAKVANDEAVLCGNDIADCATDIQDNVAPDDADGGASVNPAFAALAVTGLPVANEAGVIEPVAGTVADPALAGAEPVVAGVDPAVDEELGAPNGGEPEVGEEEEE